MTVGARRPSARFRRTCDDLLEGRSQDEVEPERRNLYGIFFSILTANCNITIARDLVYMLLWNDRADRNNVEVVQDQGRIPLMKPKPNIIASIVISLTVVASGCKVGPDYLRPAAPVSHEYIDAEDPRLLPEPDPHRLRRSRIW